MVTEIVVTKTLVFSVIDRLPISPIMSFWIFIFRPRTAATAGANVNGMSAFRTSGLNSALHNPFPVYPRNGFVTIFANQNFPLNTNRIRRIQLVIFIIAIHRIFPNKRLRNFYVRPFRLLVDLIKLLINFLTEYIFQLIKFYVDRLAKRILLGIYVHSRLVAVMMYRLKTYAFFTSSF